VSQRNGRDFQIYRPDAHPRGPQSLEFSAGALVKTQRLSEALDAHMTLQLAIGFDFLRDGPRASRLSHPTARLLFVSDNCGEDFIGRNPGQSQSRGEIPLPRSGI
jgi:hypothetical protein